MTTIPTSGGSPRSPLPVLAGLVFANALGHTFLLVMMPGLGRQLGFSDAQTGLAVGLPLLMLSLTGPLWGMAADRVGRRPVLGVALMASAVSALCLALIVWQRLGGALSVGGALAGILGVRVVQGIFGGGLMPAAQAMLADATPPHRRAGAMGLMGAAFGIGSICAAALTWRIGLTGAVTVLCALGGVMAFAAVAAMVLLPGHPWRGPDAPPLAAATGASGTGPARTVLPALVRGLWPCLVVTVFGLLTYSLLQQVTVLRLQDAFGLPANEAVKTAGGIMMLALAAMVTMQGCVGRVLRWGPARLLRLGGLLALAGGVAATLAPTVPVFAVSTALIGAGLGLVIPGNLASLSLRAGDRAQARAAGINAIAQGLGMGLGPVVGATLVPLSPLAPHAAGAVALAILCLVAFRRL